MAFQQKSNTQRCRAIRCSVLFSQLAMLGVLLLAGCSKPVAESETKTTARPLEGRHLRLAVVDDPLLAEAVLRVRGEWNAQTGAELQVDQIAAKDLFEAKIEKLPADALLCASHRLGELAERKLIAPVPQSILRGAEWGDVFELLKLREAAYGGQILAVPFGSPVFCCCYRADLLKTLNRRPPRTWAEYQELAALLAKSGERASAKKNWCGAIEPLGKGWAGLVLLARAASYAKHRDSYSDLFNMETMEPLIAGPPFVRALEELVAAAKHGPTDPLSFDPSAVRAAFWQGECGLALTWPTAADKDKTSTDKPRQVGFCELPGSRAVFNLGTKSWDDRSDEDDVRVPLLSIAGRLGVVDAKSSNVDAAFQLLLWLSDARMSPQISAASSTTTLFRQSNLKSPGQWAEKQVPALAAVQYGDATEAALRHEQWLGALRIPSRAEYLDALDEAVAAAIQGKKTPQKALAQVDRKWREITNRLGLERQRAAYRHSIGVE
jgi:multiple sugar transport system substrate-binding protein